MVLGAAVLWGSLGLFAKALYAQGISPIEIASVRAAVGLAGLALWFAWRPGRLRIPAREVPFFVLYGVVGFAVFEVLYFETVERTRVAVAVALLYTAPAFVLILARIFDREPIRPLRVLALALVLGGVFLVTGAARALGTGQAAVSATALGFGLGSGLTYGLYTLLGKRALRTHDPLRTLFWVFLFATLALALPAPPWRPMVRTPEAVPLLVALGVFPTLVAYLLYLGALRFLAAPTAAMLATIEPVVAAILGALFLGETLGLDQVAGILLVVAAALLLAWRTRGRTAPEILGS